MMWFHLSEQRQHIKMSSCSFIIVVYKDNIWSLEKMQMIQKIKKNVFLLKSHLQSYYTNNHWKFWWTCQIYTLYRHAILRKWCHILCATLPTTFQLKRLSIYLKKNFFLILFICLFLNFWLCWVFAAACELSLVVASRGYSSLWCAGFSLWWLLLLWSTDSRHAGSVAVARGL